RRGLLEHELHGVVLLSLLAGADRRRRRGRPGGGLAGVVGRLACAAIALVSLATAGGALGQDLPRRVLDQALEILLRLAPARPEASDVGVDQLLVSLGEDLLAVLVLEEVALAHLVSELLQHLAEGVEHGGTGRAGIRAGGLGDAEKLGRSE